MNINYETIKNMEDRIFALEEIMKIQMDEKGNLLILQLIEELRAKGTLPKEAKK